MLIVSGIFVTYGAYATPSIAIVDSYGYLDEEGQYLVIGEVINNGDIPAHFVEIIATFFDEGREQIEQLSVSSALQIIRPGQVSPFIVRLQDKVDASLVRSYDVRVGNMAPTTYKEEKLSVIFHKLETAEDNIVISGRLANDGSSVSANTRIMIVLYNVVDEPVRYVSTFTEPRNILPFGSATFSVRIKVDDVLSINGYAITAESSNYAEINRLVQKREGSLERIREVMSISNLLTYDASNRAVGAVNIGEPVIVRTNITNRIAESRDYTYIIQVKDQNGFVVSLSWSMGTVQPGRSVIAVIAWIPDSPGRYTLQAFVWKSIEEPVPLAFRTLTTNLHVM